MTTTPSGEHRAGAADAELSQTEVLPRKLSGLSLAVLIVAFNAPIAAMAGWQQLSVGYGTGIGAPVSFLAAGAILLLFSVGFVGMSRYMKHPGAYYCYVTEGMGKAPGLGGGFLGLMAYALISMSTFPYLAIIVGDLTERFAGQPILSWQVWALICLVGVTSMGLLRVDLSLKVIGILVILEVLAVAIWQAAILIGGGPEGYSPSSFDPTVFLSGNVGLGVLFAMLTMIGIEAGACFRDEAVNPDRSVKRATYSAIAFMGVFYAIGSWVYIVSLGPSEVVEAALGDPVGSFFTSIEQYIGVVFVNLVAVVLVTSQIASCLAVLGAASRYLHALGRDGALPRPLARVHPRLQSPHVAVLTVGALNLAYLIVLFVFSIDAVPGYATVSGVGLFFLLPLLMATSVAVIVYYRKRPELNPGPWLSLIAPALACICLGVLFVLTALNMGTVAGDPLLGVIAAVALVAVALSGFGLARRYKRTRPDVYDRIGTSGMG